MTEKKSQSQAAYRLGEEDSSWNACLGLAIWDSSALQVHFFFAMTHWKEKLSIEKNSHYRFDQSRTFLNVSIHKITFGKDSLCLLNRWETGKKKKKLPVAQKKNITNVFIVLSGLKKWHHQFSACFAWNGRRREAAFAGPSLCKEHRVAGCFLSTVHWPLSEQEPHPRPQGSLPSYS